MPPNHAFVQATDVRTKVMEIPAPKPEIIDFGGLYGPCRSPNLFLKVGAFRLGLEADPARLDSNFDDIWLKSGPWLQISRNLG